MSTNHQHASGARETRRYLPSMIRRELIARITRAYPLYSGCGSLANSSFFKWLSGFSTDQSWSRVPGGEVLASLDDYVGRAAFFFGNLDRKITWICARIVRPGDTVLDIGANIGIVSVWLSTLVGASGMVHAFEPSPKLQRVLRDTLIHNQLSNVLLHPVAFREAG